MTTIKSSVSCLCLLLVLILCSCHSTRLKSTRVKTVNIFPVTASPSPAASPLAKIDYTIPGRVPIIKQPDGMSCWAAVATMLMSWRDNKKYEIEEAVGQAGQKYLQVFRAEEGLNATEKSPFLKAMGLRSEAPQSFTVKGWLSLLQTHGPLWVTTQLRRNQEAEEKFSVHARVVVGMYEAPPANELYLRVIDPETGTQYDEKFADFFRRYENIAREDLEMGTDFQPQVIHF